MNELGMNEEWTKAKMREGYLREKCAEEVEEYMHLTTCVGPNLKTQYMLCIGQLEYRVFQLKTDVARWQRRFTLRQQALNRGETPNLVQIEAQLDEEFQDYLRQVKEHLAAIKAAAQHAKLEIADVYFAGTCAANAVLSAADRNAGVLSIDIGGGSTSYSLYEGGRNIHAGVIGVGGDHVTNDMRTAFSLTQAQCEELKRSSSAIVGGNAGPARMAVASTTPGFDPVTISRRSVETVVNARLQELFAVILDALDHENLAHRFNAGIVLTGGVSSTPDIAALAEHVFGRRARIGSFVPDIAGLENGPAPATYATVAGLLLTALHDQGPQGGENPFKRIFGGLFG